MALLHVSGRYPLRGQFMDIGPKFPARYSDPNKARITLSNGSVIQGYSADSMERARGSNLWGCWADELALFKYESFYHEVLQPALRRGEARMLITTTRLPDRRVHDGRLGPA